MIKTRTPDNSTTIVLADLWPPVAEWCSSSPASAMKAIMWSKEFMQLLLQAIQANPKASLPYIAACISQGRLALFSENKRKVIPIDSTPHARLQLFTQLSSSCEVLTCKQIPAFIILLLNRAHVDTVINKRFWPLFFHQPCCMAVTRHVYQVLSCQMSCAWSILRCDEHDCSYKCRSGLQRRLESMP